MTLESSDRIENALFQDVEARMQIEPVGLDAHVSGDIERGAAADHRIDEDRRAHLITRLPKAELKAVLIKVQHNATSNATAYPLSLPRIMHEYVVLWRKRHRVTVAGPQPPPAGPSV